MERPSSHDCPLGPPSPSASGAVSPSSGGEFLLQLLQQGRPSAVVPSSGSRTFSNKFGDGDAINSHHSSSGGGSSSGAAWPGSASFNRTSSTEACVPEEEQARTHPLSRASSAEASVLDEEQVRFQLQHDPAVAAMGPSHPVGEVSAVANSMGNMSGEGREILPFHDRYAQAQAHHQHQHQRQHQHQQHHHHHHHHEQHLCLQQIPPPSPFDVPFPRPPPPEHLLSFPVDPLLPLHNQFLRPYSYTHLPLVDHNVYFRVSTTSFSQTGLLNPKRLQDSAATLSYPGIDQLKSFPNDGVTNESGVMPRRILVPIHRSTTDTGPLPLPEQESTPPKSQFYTQFGSIGADLPHQCGNRAKSLYGSLPEASSFQQPCAMDEQTRVSHPLPTPKGIIAQSPSSVDSSKREGQQFHPANVDARTEAIAMSGEHVYQKTLLEPVVTADGSSILYNNRVEKKLERHAFPVESVPATEAPSTQKESHVNTNRNVADSITDISGYSYDCEARAKFIRPQKGLDFMRKFSGNSLGQWVPVAKDKREELTINRMESAATPEVLTSKIVNESRRWQSLNQGWRSKHLSSTSVVLKGESLDSPKKFDRSLKTKVPLQRDPLGLPSGSKVDSAPSSATEQSKQALQISPASDAIESRMVHGSADSLKTDSKCQADEKDAEAFVSCLSLSELDSDNEEEKETASKKKPSVSEELNSHVKDSDTRIGRPTKLNRRESFHRFDSGKCTSTFLAIFQTLIPPTDEERRRKELLTTLDELVSGIWPDARLYLFGSCANAFGVCNSDIDVCLSIEGESATRSEVVCTLADALKANHMQNVQALTHARVPIVKYSDPKTGISCDVCVNNMLAVVNTKLLHDYAQIDVRLRQLAFIVKHWAKCRQVNETYRGTLSSYAYVLMCIHFLQQRRPPVLPCLQEMDPTYKVTVGDITCAYFDRVDSLKGFGQNNKETLADLVSSFFDYWAFRHDYTRTVISIRTGKFLSKVEKDWTRRIGNERHLICIEDPFEVSHDLGRVVDKHSIRVLRDEFQRAARIMRQDANPCVALFEPYIRQKAQAA